MDGSGLKEAFCEIYAANSSDKALSGHAYARAIRGHFLVQLALSELIFSSMELSDTEKGLMDTSLQDLGTENFEYNLHSKIYQASKINTKKRSYRKTLDAVLANDLIG